MTQDVSVDERRRGSRIPMVLVVAATVLAVVSSMTTWVRVELLDTDEWVAVSDSLLAEPEVQDALTTYLANQLFEVVDLRTQLESALPESLTGLAGPLAGALRDPVTNSIGRLISSDRFATLWSEANRVAHTRLVNILRDETVPSVSTTDGTVTLDLGVMLRTVGESVGISPGALDRLPPGAGQVVILESDELSAVQRVVQVLDVLSWFLFLLVAAMYALAVYLARDRRLQMLRNVGVALVVAGVVVLLLRALAIRVVVGAVVENPAREPLGTLVAGVATELLRETAWTGIVYGIAIAAFAMLLGDQGWARGTRAVIGRATRTRGATALAAGVLLLLLLWWSPGRVFDRWVTALVFLGLVVGAVTALLTVVARERDLAPSE